MAEASPFLKWAGGKGRLLSLYEPYVPKEFKRYLEPFVGGGAMFFWLANRKQPLPALLSDLNAELLEVYQEVQQHPGALLDCLRQHAAAHDQDYYYAVRSQDALGLSRLQRAARLLYLNKTCYNGLYRVNSKGQFNVPIGRYKEPNIVQEERIWAAHAALQEAELVVASFETVCQGARKGDFVYLDPPYQPLNATSNFTGYTKESFGEAQQLLLAQCFEKMVRRGCHVLLSNSDTEFVRYLYRNYQARSISAARSINSKSAGRGVVAELLVVGQPR
jgi:DNA adenine methylase